MLEGCHSLFHPSFSGQINFRGVAFSERHIEAQEVFLKA
jgi:hypothetical protein